MSDLERGKTVPQCNCPPIRDVFRWASFRRRPCPVHDDPEFLSKIKFLPIERREA